MIDLEWLTTQVAGLVRETGVFIAAELEIGRAHV